MSRPDPKTAGFSLVELLVVLAILGIMSIAVYNFSFPRQNKAVRSIANDVAGVLNDAQSLARNTGKRVFLQTSGAGATFRLTYGFYQLPDGTDDLAQTNANWNVGNTFVIPNGTRYALVDDSTTNLMGTASPSPDLRTNTTFVPAGSVQMAPRTDRADLTKALWFMTDGAPSRNFFVPIVGVRGENLPYSTAPVALVVVVAGSKPVAYYKDRANSGTWVRMP